MLEYSMTVKLLTKHHLEFLSLKGGCTGSSESIHVKMPHCWKSHVVADIGRFLRLEQLNHKARTKQKTVTLNGSKIKQ